MLERKRTATEVVVCHTAEEADFAASGVGGEVLKEDQGGGERAVVHVTGRRV